MDGDRLIYGAEYGLSRRKALGGVALGTTFALAVQPVQAQTMIVTPPSAARRDRPFSAP